MNGRRLFRYLISGLASLFTHLFVLLLLVEGFGMVPAPASAVGFAASVLVSFLLQRNWVFASTRKVSGSFPRFALVTGFGFVLNLSVMVIGVDYFSLHYLLVQGVAFMLVPLSNYCLNGLWTFAGSG